MKNGRERIMVKYGSKCVVGENGSGLQKIDGYSPKIAQLHKSSDVLITTSGAVAKGALLRTEMGKTAENVDERTLASNGSALIVADWNHGLRPHGLMAGQVIISDRDMKKTRTRNFVSAYEEMGYDTIPVINKNDVMTRRNDKNEELARLKIGGDNDWLAVMAAELVSATVVIFCTSGVEGVEVDGELQNTIHVADLEDLREHMRPGNDEGKGSMLSKVMAASWGVEVGNMKAYICNADANYESMLAGQKIGTQVIQ
jgi:glutamate 5-kinase